MSYSDAYLRMLLETEFEDHGDGDGSSDAPVSGLAFSLDARDVPAGPLPGAFGNSPFTVTGGALEHVPTVPANGAAYYERTLPGPVARIGALADWDADADGSVALVVPSASWAAGGLSNAGLHATINASGFVTVGRFESGAGVVNPHTGSAADLAGGRHIIEAALDPRRSTLTVYVDGAVVVSYEDPTAFGMLGSSAVWELYEVNGSSDRPARLLAVWADVDARIPAAAPLPGNGVPAAAPGAAPQLAAAALSGSYNTTVSGTVEIGEGAARMTTTVPASGRFLCQLSTFLDLYADDNVLVQPVLTYTDGSGTETGDAISLTQKAVSQRFTVQAAITATPGKEALVSWNAFKVGAAGAVFRSGGATGSGYVSAIPLSA